MIGCEWFNARLGEIMLKSGHPNAARIASFNIQRSADSNRLGKLTTEFQFDFVFLQEVPLGFRPSPVLEISRQSVLSMSAIVWPRSTNNFRPSP